MAGEQNIPGGSHAHLKILILKPSSLGDVVQAIPVLRLLKKHLPESRIYWWLSADLFPLLDGDPDLEGIFLFERHRWRHPKHWGRHLQEVREIREHKFDLVIDLQGLARSGLLGWLARGGTLIGLDDPREGAPGFYDVRVPRPTPNAHAVDWYLSVLTSLNVPANWDFEWLPMRPSVSEGMRRKWNVEGPWIAICPGARWINKRWPVEYFESFMGRAKRDFPGIRFVILGGKDDAQLGRRLQEMSPDSTLDLTARTSIPELTEWIRISELLITNDTGPMHIGAALGKHVLAIFGPTDPRRTGPYHQLGSAVRVEMECAPCMTDTCHFSEAMGCLRRITPEVVYARAKGWLDKKRGE